MFSTILIGFSLAMDAFAVSLSSGISIRDLRFFYAVRASFFFGFFQFAMPVAGWYLGMAFASYIEAFDHWVAFGLLSLIGGKMLFETLRERKNEETGASGRDIRSLPCLFLLSVATSIDALAVGLSFSLLGQDIWAPAILISAITFAVCLAGFEFGRRIGAFLEKRTGILGGLILIGIGIKILLEHLLARG